MIGDTINNEQHTDIAVPIPSTADSDSAREVIDSIPDYDESCTIEKIIQKILKDDKQYDKNNNWYYFVD